MKPETPITDLPPELLNYLLEKCPDEPLTAELIAMACEEIKSNKEKDELPPCPICGANAFLHRDVVQGFYFGWSVGCPRYCLNDKIHGHDENTPPEKHLTGSCFPSKEAAAEWWKRRVQDEKENWQ